jgi:peptidoglycan hydrolase-like protein with peptidoglycan-binding domain
MKAAGFDAGPIDGIMGPKTTSTLAALQSGCAMTRLFPTSSNLPVQAVETALNSKKRIRVAMLRSPVISDSAKNGMVTSAGNRTPSQDEIQLVQVRLKEAGFDPGPIDGIMGPKTRTAIQRYRTTRGLRNSPIASSGIEGILE